MNRIGQRPAPAKKAWIESAFRIESAKYAPPSQSSPRALFIPLHYEPNYAYPLIVWLHGPNHDEGQLLRIMPVISARNYAAVAPRGCETGTGRGWEQTAEHIQQAEQRVYDSIEAACARVNVARNRIFLAGQDSGGTMAIRVAMNQPHRFAGVLSLGGPLPEGHAPFGRLTDVRRLQLLLAVGRDSLAYPARLVCENLRLLHAAGMLVTLRQYPCGHELTEGMLGDVDRWIMEQVTQNSQASRQPRNVH